MTLVVLLAVVSPALRDRDSFPLSTYPMYARARSDTASFSTVVGVDDRGERRSLSLPVIADTDDPLIGHARVEQAIADAAAPALCADVAARVSSDVDRVEVVTEQHDLVALISGDDSLLGRNVHATCETT